MICYSCKKEITDGSTYCNHCGANQSKASEEAELQNQNHQNLKNYHL